MFASSRFFSAFLSALLLGALACATNVAGSSGGEPQGDAGSSGASDSASDAGTATKPAILAVAADAKAGYTGAAFDGFTWKLHTISGESTPTYPSMATAVASDTSGLVVIAPQSGKPPRFARWNGGDAWSAFSDIPNAAKFYGQVAAIFRNGVFVVAYASDPTGVVFQLFDPKTNTWTAPKKFDGPGVTEYIRLEPSAAGPSEVYVAVQFDASAFGASFKPSMGGDNVVKLERLVEGYHAFRAPVVTDKDGAHATQIGIIDNGHTVSANAFVAAPPVNKVQSLGGCDHFVALGVLTDTSTVSVLCSGQSTYYRYEGTLGGTPLDVTWGELTKTNIKPLGNAELLPGIGPDTRYLMGVNAGKAAVLRNLEGDAEPFADADQGFAVSYGR